MVFHELPEIHLVVREDKVYFVIVKKLRFESDYEKRLLDNVIMYEKFQIMSLSDYLLGHTFWPICSLDFLDRISLPLLVDNFEHSPIWAFPSWANKWITTSGVENSVFVVENLQIHCFHTTLIYFLNLSNPIQINIVHKFKIDSLFDQT